MQAFNNFWHVNPNDPKISVREIREADAYIRHQGNYRLTRKGQTYLRLMPKRVPFWRAFAQELGWPFWLGVAAVVAFIWKLLP